MLGYLFDLIKKDIDLGMKAVNVIFTGYPDLPKTDLFGPYYDSVSTRRLWVKAKDRLDMSEYGNAALALNTYFRWYLSTYELFRKMLIFDCYCLGLYTGREINVRNYLFHMHEPAKYLESSGPKKRKDLIKFYDSKIRHAISHGNTIIIPNRFVVIRETGIDKETVIEKIYDDTEEFLSTVPMNIEIMFGAIRFFYFILSNCIFAKYSGLFEKYIGNSFTDEVLIAMVKSIGDDPKNPVF